MRQTFVQLHIWFGLTLGALWAVQGLTGSLLVFHRDFGSIRYAALSDAPMAPMSVLINAAEQEAGQPIREIAAIGPDPRILEARYGTVGEVQGLRLEAATGRVVGSAEWDPASPFTGSAWRWILLVHKSLNSGVAGETIIGFSGLFLLTSAAIGLGIAWPKRRQWRAVFSFRKWRSTPQKLYGWHRAVGLLAVSALLVMSTTGVYMTFHAQAAPMLQRVLPFDTIAVKSGSPGSRAALVTPDAVMELAHTRFPEGRLTSFQTPVANPGLFVVRLVVPGEWRRWSGSALIKVDARSGAVAAVYDPIHGAPFNRVDNAIFPFHTGEAVGLAGRLLVAFAGLSVPLFYTTGLLLWLRKRRGKKRKLPMTAA